MRAFRFITRIDGRLISLDTEQLVHAAFDERFARDSLEHAHKKIDITMQLFLQLALGGPSQSLCEFVAALGWPWLAVVIEEADGQQYVQHYEDTAGATTGTVITGEDAKTFIRGLLEDEDETGDLGTHGPGAAGSGLPQQPETPLVGGDELVGGAARDGDGQPGTVSADNRDSNQQDPAGD